MIKFTMNAKELKTMMDKAMTVVNKKASVPSLKRLYFSIDDKGILKILSTDIEHYVEARTENTYHTEPGMFGIDIEDIKIISKMSGEITIEDITSDKEEKINIKCGKKNVSIPRFENTDVSLPVLDNGENILDVKENWLSETISNLSVFVSNREEVNRMMSVFNFNTKEKRVEALWNCMIGMRQLEDGYDCDFYADHPWEGNLIDIVYGNNIDELRGNGENEGMFYMLYLAENGERIGYGCVDFDTIEETISRYELEKCKDMNTTWTKDDIINALVEDGIEPTNANIVKVITAEFVQNFKDRIIELGNEMISWQVSDVFKKKGE